MNVINENTKIPIFSWCPDIETGAMEQMKVIANTPFVTHCALMPDAHQGASMPIGGVVACNDVIVPNFVGVDIGCGMCAIKTNLTVDSMTREHMESLYTRFNRSIPVGFNRNTPEIQKKLQENFIDKYTYIYDKTISKVDAVFKPVQNSMFSFFEQCGTLGGGNHFLEIQKDENGFIWIMIHSGSRNLGMKICEYFNKIAITSNKKYYSCVPESIPFLPLGMEETNAYIQWMKFALQFAFFNRKLMMDYIMKDFIAEYKKVTFDDMINIHHNYANLESHFGKNVWVHRKGATFAGENNIGIIPGSMGTSSYIVEGLDNTKSLLSSSHGAGRTMSRTAFNIKMNSVEGMDEINKSLEGIVHTKFEKESSRKKKPSEMLDVSEAPQAYKNIDQVMENQKDLVKIVTKLSPMISMKG